MDMRDSCFCIPRCFRISKKFYHCWYTSNLFRIWSTCQNYWCQNGSSLNYIYWHPNWWRNYWSCKMRERQQLRQKHKDYYLTCDSIAVLPVPKIPLNFRHWKIHSWQKCRHIWKGTISFVNHCNHSTMGKEWRDWQVNSLNHCVASLFEPAVKWKLSRPWSV